MHERDIGKNELTDNLTPKAIVAALDEHIIGQKEAKRAVAVALRNRWRRQRLGPELRDEVTPKNILMIGPTGCGKTEVGYVGRDVDQIARDLAEEAIRLEKERRREAVRDAASKAAMDRLLNALVGENASEATREAFRQRIVENAMNDTEVEIEVRDQPGQQMDIPGMPGGVGMIDLSDMLGKAMGKNSMKRRKLKVPDAWDRLVDEEAEKRMDQDDVNRVALENAETNGIVFLDEIDKIAVSDVRGGSVSREGVQRDLLPLIEGTTVATKYGPMKTDHILFIASGAFHVSKPSDMLPELQGRLPIRVELRALTEEDFVRILKETRANLVEQYKALIGTENVTLDFTEDAITEVAKLAARVNETVENIGARRLQTVMERLLEEISFEAEDHAGETIMIDAAYVRERLETLAGDTDLSKYIL